MEAIKDTVRSMFEELTVKAKGSAVGNPEEWLKKVLTKKELGHIKFNYFKKGVLGVSVDSSSWLYSLKLKQDALLEKLKANKFNVKEIHFRIGEIK